MKFTKNGALLVGYYFVAWIGGTMAWFVQPFYFSSLGYTYAQLGVIFSLMSISQAIGFLFSGPLVLRLGYKRSIYIAVAFFAITRVIHVAIPIYSLLLLASISFGIGLAIENPAFMSLLSSASEDRHGIFSTNWGAATIGGAIGTLLGGYISSTLGYRWALAIAAIFLPLQAAFMMFVEEDSNGFGRRLSISKCSLIRIIALSFPIAILGLGAGVILSYMGLWFKSSYGMSIAEVGIAFTLLQFVMGLGSFIAPHIASRTGTGRLIASFTALSGIFITLMPISSSFALALALYSLRMLLVNTEVPIWDSYYVSHFHEGERATAIALKGFGWTVAFAAGQFFGGIMFEGSLSLPLIVGGILHMLSATSFMTMERVVSRFKARSCTCEPGS